MQQMLALYILFFLLTFLVLGIFHFAGKRKFGARSEHQTAVSHYIKVCVRIISVLGAVSILLITFGKIPPNSISYLCIPFFIVLAGTIGYYFRVAKHFNLTHTTHTKR